MTVMRTGEVAEERDLVGVYLHEISKTPLLDAAQEVILAKAVEAGLYAAHLIHTDDWEGARAPRAAQSNFSTPITGGGPAPPAPSWRSWSSKASAPRTSSSGQTSAWWCPSP